MAKKDKVSDNETPEPVEEEEVVETEPEEEETEDDTLEVVEEVVPITFDAVIARVTGIVSTVKDEGLTATSRRFFAGLEGFLGGVAGDDEKKPPRKG